MQAVEDEMRSRDLILTLARENLQEAQSRMKLHAEKKRTQKEYSVGDWVYLRLRLYRQMTVAVRKKFEAFTKVLRAIPNHPKKLGKLHINSIYPKTPRSTRYFTFHAPKKKKKLGLKLTLTLDYRG